ncbi:hypothetical protein [Noviherbaspirillum sp. ST9]|uniref:hypothetical protein n=1 Tax=Noviherbaspirillum sp. ST9 TaxID=3401606 RepID=UPI003B589F01
MRYWRLAAVFLALLWHLPGLGEEHDSFALADAYGYERLVILFPGDRTTVFDNDGEIDVHLLTLTNEHRAPGNRVELVLDGRRISPGKDRELALRNVAPGLHWLRARIVTANGTMLLDSRPVRFFKWPPTISTQQAGIKRAEPVP